MPSDDEIREAVLADRLRFEAKLATGVAGLPENRFVTLKYETLVADPARATEALYSRVSTSAISLLCVKLSPPNRRAASDYRARSHPPQGIWRDRINTGGPSVFARYGYSPL